MAAVTIRNLSAETHRALKVRAAHHGRSTEAEMREILEAAVRPISRVKLGSLLASIGREAGGLTETEVDQFAQLRDKTPFADPLAQRAAKGIRDAGLDQAQPQIRRALAPSRSIR
jgi:plasmid stability protein